MPRNGSGTYERVVAPYQEGEVAEADGAAGVNTEMDDVAAALTASLARNGEAPWTGDQDADGFTLGGLRASASNGEAVRHEQLSALSSVYEAKDATLTAIAGTTFAAGQVLRATGPDTFTVDDTTSFGRGLWNVADLAAHTTALGGASAIRTAYGLVIGTDVQAYDADTAKTDVAQTWTAAQTFPNTGLKALDTDASHALTLKPGSNITAARTLTLTTGDADRMLDISAASVTITAAAASVLDDASVGAMCTTLGAAQLGAANNFVNQQTFQHTTPLFRFRDTDAATNKKEWWEYYADGIKIFAWYDDTPSAATNYLTITRSTGYTDGYAEYDGCDLRLEPTPGTLTPNSAGFRSAGPGAEKTGDYTFVQADEGQAIDHNSASPHTFTLNTGVHSDNAILFGTNHGAGALTIARGAGITFADANGTNANLTVNQHQNYVLRKRRNSATWSVRVY